MSRSQLMLPPERVGRPEEGDGEGRGGLRNFSVRLPAGLHEELGALAARTDQSMNKLVGDAVARLLERPDLAPTSGPGDINARIAQDAIKQTDEAIGPLKGIAKHVSNRGQIALASVLYAAAARAIRDKDGPEEASRELARSAMAAEQSKYYELAVALYDASLAVDKNNLEAANRLGQRLHHLAAARGDDLDRYRKAADLLGRVTFIDDHAKLFHGWSMLHVARADKDPYAEERAVDEIEEALKKWAFSERSDKDRRSWLRQVQRLVRSGLQPRAEQLVEFANHTARWRPIGAAELKGSASEEQAVEAPASSAD